MIYYRVEVGDNNEGYFNYLKTHLKEKEWHRFKESDLATWLPTISEEYYDDEFNETWFTPKGFYEFIKYFAEYRNLVGQDLKIKSREIDDYVTRYKFIYEDKYQVVMKDTFLMSLKNK